MAHERESTKHGIQGKLVDFDVGLFLQQVLNQGKIEREIYHPHIKLSLQSLLNAHKALDHLQWRFFAGFSMDELKIFHWSPP